MASPSFKLRRSPYLNNAVPVALESTSDYLQSEDRIAKQIEYTPHVAPDRQYATVKVCKLSLELPGDIVEVLCLDYSRILESFFFFVELLRMRNKE
ncbi:hypothetical protein NDU88_004126 [Pleurodeles waltl]|uniref:Uncharacterized protein n=1 Tax=Pleurodeles waltl TaxID=8319 RepID=A0AAV7MSK9_PLEWA|nr:hypothetical protein NDU88_004126 [Pleurodeles waltl]